MPSVGREETTVSEDIRGQAVHLSNDVDYADGAIVSKTLLNKKAGTLTLFAFDAGQSLSEHTAPYDATVLVTDGEALLVIDGEELRVPAGNMVIMPANIPHDVQAEKRFKMLLIIAYLDPSNTYLSHRSKIRRNDCVIIEYKPSGLRQSTTLVHPRR